MKATYLGILARLQQSLIECYCRVSRFSDSDASLVTRDVIGHRCTMRRSAEAIGLPATRAPHRAAIAVFERMLSSFDGIGLH